MGRNNCPTGDYIKPAGHNFCPWAVFFGPRAEILSRGPKMTNTTEANTDACVNFACKRPNFADVGVKNGKILRMSFMDGP